MKIKNFACFKNEKEAGSKQPDYRLSARGEKDGEYINIGAGWVKEGKSGKFISFTLSEPYQEKHGFSIIVDDEMTDKDGF